MEKNSAIPIKWNYFLQQHVPISEISEYSKMNLENKIRNIYNITEKEIKNIFKKEILKSTCQIKAQKKYDTILNDLDWKEIYNLPFSLMVDNKVSEMQYKILHRIISTVFIV